MIIQKTFLMLLFGFQHGLPQPLPVVQDLQAHDVKVLIHDIRPKEGGELLVGLLNEQGTQVLSAKVVVHGSEVRVVFKEVRTGTYAVRYFQDVNANGKLDMGWFNIPDEGVGCSNDAKGFMRAPDLKDMLFNVDRSMTVESHINYY